MPPEKRKNKGTAPADWLMCPLETKREPMHVSYAREMNSGIGQPAAAAGNQQGCKISHRINRFCVYYVGAYICNIDFDARRPEETSKRASLTWKKEEISKDAGRKDEGCTMGARLMSSYLVRRCCRPLEQSEWKRRLRFGWIPQAILGCMLTFILYLLVSTYFQYRYDFDLLRIQRLLQNQQEMHDKAVQMAPAAKVADLTARLSGTKAVLDFLGADLQAPILVECYYLIIISICLLLYLTLYVHYRFQSPYDYYIFRHELLVDNAAGDRRNSETRMIEAQVSRYLDSSQAYYKDILADRADLEPPNFGVSPPTSYGWAELVGDPRRALGAAGGATGRRHRRALEINRDVREMLRSGALAPINRLRSWTERRALMQSTYHIIMTVYAITFSAALYKGFSLITTYSAQQQHQQQERSASGLAQIACISLMGVIVPASCVHATTFIVVVLDQINYINQLCLMIKRCIELNSREFASAAAAASAANRWRPNESPEAVVASSTQLHAPQRSSIGRASCGKQHLGAIHVKVTQRHLKLNFERFRQIQARREIGASALVELNSKRRTMNSNLIFCLLHYRIFVAQLMPLKRSLGVMGSIAYAVLFVTPLIARLHEPYVGQLNDAHFSSQDIKSFAIVLSLSVLLPANFASVPLCSMFARCKDLYENLSSLTAHVSDIKARQNKSSGGGGGGGLGDNYADYDNYDDDDDDDGQVYDSYTESCLMKELSDPHRFLEKLTVRGFCNLASTYTVLVEAHFWYGLIIISNMIDGRNVESGQGDSLGWLLRDPLRVY